MKNFLPLILLLSMITSGCNLSSAGYQPLDFSEGSQEQIDNKKIIDHLVANDNLNAKNTASGIYYTITEPGTGKAYTDGAKVTADYTGTLLDGTQFDSSIGKRPLNFQLNGVIKGWGEAIPILKEGGKGTFYIPSGLAYGARKVGNKISANSVLKFEIEIVKYGE